MSRRGDPQGLTIETDYATLMPVVMTDGIEGSPLRKHYFVSSLIFFAIF